MNLKLKKYLLVLIMSGCGYSLIACSKNENVKETEKVIEITSEYETEKVTEIQTEVVTEISKDDVVINYYDEIKNKINNYINSSDFDNLKSSGKELFITTVDFLFYEGDIKGVYLSDVKDTTKMIVVERFTEADSIIEAYLPGYKDTVSEKYQRVSSFLKENVDKLGNKITDFLGPDVIDDFGNVKTSVIDAFNSTKDKVKDKANDWYQNYKNNEN